MARRGSGLAGKLLALAEAHHGRFVTTEEAVQAIFNGSGDEAARKRVYQAVYHLHDTGRLRCKRGAFAWPSCNAAVLLSSPSSEELPPDEDRDEIQPAPPAPLQRGGAAAALAHQLNILAMVVNGAAQALHYEIGETRRLMNLAQAPSETDEQPSGFRLTRFSSTSSTLTVRRR